MKALIILDQVSALQESVRISNAEAEVLGKEIQAIKERFWQDVYGHLRKMGATCPEEHEYTIKDGVVYLVEESDKDQLTAEEVFKRIFSK